MPLPSGSSFRVLFKLVDRNSYNTLRTNGVTDIEDMTDLKYLFSIKPSNIWLIYLKQNKELQYIVTAHKYNLYEKGS